MRSFSKSVAFAALAAYTRAVCVDGTDVADFECANDFTHVNQIVVDTSGDYQWTFDTLTNAAGYKLRMFRFTGDESGGIIAGQDEKIPVLFVHDATKDCLSWLESSQNETADSLPLQLFKAGHTVFLGCRRGTEFSHTHGNLDLNVDADREQYFDYNTKTVGVEDIATFIDAINADVLDEGVTDCGNKVNVVTHGVGAGEVLAGLAGDATLADKISLLLNLAPCPITTNLGDAANDERRMLKSVSAPRELEQIVEEEMGLRELGHSYYYNSYWTRIEQYCTWNPDSCLSYCDWYPDYCDEFCSRFPQWCVPQPPASIKNRQIFLDLFDELNIYSRYGPNWEAQVDEICAEVSQASCDAFKATISDNRRRLTSDEGLKEMGIKQYEHMWQQSYFKKFNEYWPTWATDGWTADIPEINVADIATRMINFYPSSDDECDIETNKTLLDTSVGQLFRTRFTEEEVDQDTIQGQNSGNFVELFVAAMNIGAKDATSGADICTVQ